MNLLHETFNHIRKSSLEKHDQKLRDYLKGNLSQFGYEFETEEEFEEFVKTRITAIDSNESVNIYNLYLDFESDKKLVGVFSMNISTKITGNEITVIIG